MSSVLCTGVVIWYPDSATAVAAAAAAANSGYPTTSTGAPGTCKSTHTQQQQHKDAHTILWILCDYWSHCFVSSVCVMSHKVAALQLHVLVHEIKTKINLLHVTLQRMCIHLPLLPLHAYLIYFKFCQWCRTISGQRITDCGE